MKNLFEKVINNDRAVFLCFGSLITLLYFLVLQPENIIGNYFFERDYIRSLQFADSFRLGSGGPELSGGGNSVGPFLYVFMAIPHIFGRNILGTLLFLSLIYGFSISYLFCFLRKKFDPLLVFTCLQLIILSPVILFNIRVLWNPAFMPPFLIASLVLYDQAHNSKRQYIYSLLCGFFIGLTTQIHSSAFFLTFGLLIQFLNFRKYRYGPMAYLLGIFLAIGPIQLFVKSFGAFSSSHFEDFLFNSQYFVLMSLSEITSKLMQITSLHFWKSLFIPLFIVLNPFLIGVLYLLKERNNHAKVKTYRNMYFWPLISAALPTIFYLFIDPSTSRHSISFIVILPFFILYCGNSFLPQNRKSNLTQPLFASVIGVAFIALFLFSFQLIATLNQRGIPAGAGTPMFGRILNLKDHQIIREAFKAKSMYWWENSRLNLYFAGLDRTSFIPMVFPSDSMAQIISKDLSQGFLVADGKIDNPISFLPVEIRAEIESGLTNIEKVIDTSELKIFFYKTLTQSSYPLGFSNVRFGYQNARQGDSKPVLELFRRLFREKTIREYSANLCEEYPNTHCDLQLLTALDKSESEYVITLLLYSKLAEGFSYWSSPPEGALKLLDTTLEYSCGNKKIDMNLSRYIGFKPKVSSKSEEFDAFDQGLALPLVKRFTVLCKSDLELTGIRFQDGAYLKMVNSQPVFLDIHNKFSRLVLIPTNK